MTKEPRTIKLRLTLLTSFIILFSGASFADDTLLPSQLLKDPEKYNGQHISLRGYVSVGPEERNIFDSEEEMKNKNSQSCIGLDAPDKKFKRPNVVYGRYTEGLSGVFRKKLCKPNEICLFWCNGSGIELDPDSKPVN